MTLHLLHAKMAFTAQYVHLLIFNNSSQIVTVKLDQNSSIETYLSHFLFHKCQTLTVLTSKKYTKNSPLTLLLSHLCSIACYLLIHLINPSHINIRFFTIGSCGFKICLFFSLEYLSCPNICTLKISKYCQGIVVFIFKNAIYWSKFLLPFVILPNLSFRGNGQFWSQFSLIVPIVKFHLLKKTSINYKRSTSNYQNLRAIWNFCFFNIIRAHIVKV